ncbi:MAG: hypothetical protein ACKVUT_03470, partial [Gaiella sp.]
PATPPTRPKPKPKPKPKVKTCPVFVIQQRTITAGSRSTISIRVTSGGKSVAGAKLRIKGPGIDKFVTADESGRVTTTVRASEAGIITIKLTRPAKCAEKRVGVLGAFEPPVTG